MGGPHYLVFPLAGLVLMAGLVLKAVKLGGENTWVKESQHVNYISKKGGLTLFTFLK